MIFFCEDCGGKNNLSPEQYETGKALFRCSSCHYLNSYVFQIPEKKKPLLKKFMTISSISGVDQYILIEQNGKIAVHDIIEAEKTAKKIFSFCQNSFKINKDKSTYLILASENKNKIYIFPVGNYYLAVVKSKLIDSLTLVDNVVKFLKDLSTKRT